ncbi:hypothetical protein LCGC14_1382980 [marine sediment metagenome]|uniref:Uncharacterized protein n=1 Tax=marine sediment metagenome TaxID=412755 RepID=A0A0F9K244_9ZZZZ
MNEDAKTKAVIVANIMIGVLDPSKEFTSDLVQEVGERSYDAALKKAEEHGCDHCMTCLISKRCEFKHLRGEIK